MTTTQFSKTTRNHGLVLISKPVGSVAIAAMRESIVREATTGRVVVCLPQVWAVAETPSLKTAQPAPAAPLAVEVAFYRKYTQALLRRYMRLSMEAGRVPSLLKQEMFRAKVTSYRVQSFEDVVIFCHDIDRCLQRLNTVEAELIARIALQEYTQGEAAALTGMSLRSVVQKYAQALDKLTKIFLELKMLEPLKSQ